MGRAEAPPVPVAVMTPEITQPTPGPDFNFGRSYIESTESLVTLPLQNEVPFVRRPVNLYRRGIALHELKHALAALGVGATIVGISVEKDGGSLGRTIIGGYIDPKDLQVVAAGGSVDTPENKAYGYGSDMYKVEYVADRGGMPVDSAKSKALGYITREWLPEERLKAAEIIEFLGEVPGEWLPDIMKRAKLEVDLEKAGINGRLIFPEVVDQKQAEQMDLSKGKFTLIDRLRNHVTRVRYIIDGKIDKEEFICQLCLGRDRLHDPKCLKVQKINERQRLPESLESEEKKEEDNFPEFGRIFTREELNKNPLNDHELLAA